MRAIAIGAVLSLVAAIACGEAGLREPKGCPPFEPPPAGRQTAYATAVVYGLERMVAVEEEFRLAWPDRRLRERREFREAFVSYAHAMRCLARQLLALQPSGEPFASYDRYLEGELAVVLAILDTGWEAVDERNRTEYRAFIGRADELKARLEAAANGARGLP